MFGWLWKANRWYDDLNRLDLRTQRFLIFFAVACGILIIVPVIGMLFGLPKEIGNLASLALLLVMLIPRVMWIESKTLNAKYPSKYPKE